MYGRFFPPIVFAECFALAAFMYWAVEMGLGPIPDWYYATLVALPIVVFVLMIAFYLLWRAAIGRDTPVAESALHLLTIGFGYGVAWMQWGFWLGCLVITAALVALHYFVKLVERAADREEAEWD